ncbi:MAG TPA: 30S ribosome-binding factor RbfA [Dongiaceae bacterium]|jgi:ribosome-binding factor A
MTRKRSQGPSQRQLRVGEALRHALVEILARDELRDPALSGIQVTVTEVRVSPDLRAGTAFVLPFGGGDAAALARALNRAAGYFRKTLADSVELRVAPTIRFEPDLAFGQADRIEELLRSPAVARDLSKAQNPAKDGEEPEGPEGDDDRDDVPGEGKTDGR